MKDKYNQYLNTLNPLLSLGYSRPALSNGNIMQTTHIILNFLIATLKT